MIRTMIPVSMRLLFLLSALLGATGHAQAGTTEAAMSAALDRYYAAEQGGGVAIGLAAGGIGILAGGLLVRGRGAFARGFGWPLLAFGAMTGIGAAVYAFRVEDTYAAYAHLLSSDPAAYRAAELQHMLGVQQGFRRIIATDLGVAGAGLGTAVYGALRGRSRVTGVGTGVLVSALLLTGAELHNRARAAGYLEEIRAYSPNLSIGFDGHGPALGVSWHRRF
ncbi:hypothetical protein F3J16_09165 [Burkholderia sp. Ap-962]|uniref:hypothetical protein n=1 Tax=Burkholderia sp. Ap-962 TaxID=2608333 RepID=UPI001422162D|nr:hypothetical protein [Burkholderia sp. Ap-962]NIF70352.1 hypothetical protein [Burkholderia sp. Ap-962]